MFDVQRAKKRHSALKTERSSWDSHWQEISDVLMPRSGRFESTKRNDGQKKHNKIYDNTGTLALRTLSAGLMAGMTSPARPWFRVSIKEKELTEVHAVKLWLSEVTEIMLTVFQRSNFYRALHGCYDELGAFGTGVIFVEKDYKDVICCYLLTVGEYCIATDYKGKANALYREFDMTVEQLVKQFGYDNCSMTVKSLYDNKNLDAWVTVVHVVEPRIDRDTTKVDSKNMPFVSVYFELSSDSQVLRESGLKSFRVLAPRWDVTGSDIYGESPAMEALGDIKQLQHEQLRKAQAIDYQTNPPLQIPASSKNKDTNLLPGGITYVDMTSNTNVIRSAFDVPLRLDYLLQDIGDVRQRINSAFYADMFLMMANTVNNRMTATEVAERHEEKLLMIGPVLERLHNELLQPAIEITFEIMLESGLVPEPPQELQGIELDVEFVSMLAQAQRAISVNSLDRFVSSIAGLSQYKPEILDKLNPDAIADHLQESLGISPELIHSNETVQAMRQARIDAQQQQAQQEQMMQAAETAKALSQAKMNDESALTNVTGMFNGYSAPNILQ